MTPLQDDDLLLVQRSTDYFSTTPSDIASFVKDGGFTGSITLDGRLLTFEDGILVSVV